MNREAIENLDEFDESEPVYEVCDVDQAQPQWTQIREGVNYVEAWRAGRRAALSLRAALSRTSLQGLITFTRIRADGSAVVIVELEQPIAEALAKLIDEALSERLGNEPKGGD